MVEAARLAFQERQVVYGLEKYLLSTPTPGVPGKKTVLVDEANLIDRGDDDHLPVGVANGDGVVVGLESHERLRIDSAVGHTPGLERPLRQRQKRGRIVLEQFPLGAGAASGPFVEIPAA
jgi:hypothetical protein